MNKSDDGKRKTGQPEWKPAGKLPQWRQSEAFLCYLFTKEWTKKLYMHGGPRKNATPTITNFKEIEGLESN